MRSYWYRWDAYHCKTARIETMPISFEFAEFTVRGVYFVARLCFLESRKLILLYCGVTQVYFHSTKMAFSVDNQETLIKFTPNVWFCHTHKTPLVALDPFYGSILFIFLGPKITTFKLFWRKSEWTMLFRWWWGLSQTVTFRVYGHHCHHHSKPLWYIPQHTEIKMQNQITAMIFASTAEHAKFQIWMQTAVCGWVLAGVEGQAASERVKRSVEWSVKGD